MGSTSRFVGLVCTLVVVWAQTSLLEEGGLSVEEVSTRSFIGKACIRGKVGVCLDFSKAQPRCPQGDTPGYCRGPPHVKCCVGGLQPAPTTKPPVFVNPFGPGEGTAPAAPPAPPASNVESSFEKTVTDPGTGYKLFMLKPNGWDGTADVYFPGDRTGITRAISTTAGFDLVTHTKNKWSAGMKTALVIVEGNKAAIPGGSKGKYRYSGIYGKFEGIIKTMAKELGKTPRIHALGHSRGGSALWRILRKNDGTQHIFAISCLDSTYGSTINNYLVNWSKAGKAFNIAFIKGSPTSRSPLSIRSKLALPVASNEQVLWKSKNIVNKAWKSDNARIYEMKYFNKAHHYTPTVFWKLFTTTGSYIPRGNSGAVMRG